MVSVGNRTAEGKTEPAASGVATASVVQADERFEDAFAVLRRDAVTIIDHGQHGLAVRAFRGDLDARVSVPL
ncbi:MAG: hypothetical protein JWQ95_4352 [Sphaerisporangium sp.]|jgi:hypothetical protein|nr:hypothetical protein [Sphaerisporangium sp.]